MTAKRQAPKLNALGANRGESMASMYIPQPSEPTLGGVYRTHKGLYKMEQPHTQRLNMVMPPQLLEAFESVTESEHGPRSRSAVIEHLMIEYCKEHGVRIDE